MSAEVTRNMPPTPPPPTPGFLKEGCELINEALNLFNNVYGAMHVEICACLRLLARLNYIMGDHAEVSRRATAARCHPPAHNLPFGVTHCPPWPAGTEQPAEGSSDERARPRHRAPKHHPRIRESSLMIRRWCSAAGGKSSCIRD